MLKYICVLIADCLHFFFFRVEFLRCPTPLWPKPATPLNTCRMVYTASPLPLATMPLINKLLNAVVCGMPCGQNAVVMKKATGFPSRTVQGSHYVQTWNSQQIHTVNQPLLQLCHPRLRAIIINQRAQLN